MNGVRVVRIELDHVQSLVHFVQELAHFVELLIEIGRLLELSEFVIHFVPVLLHDVELRIQASGGISLALHAVSVNAVFELFEQEVVLDELFLQSLLKDRYISKNWF